MIPHLSCTVALVLAFQFVTILLRTLVKSFDGFRLGTHLDQDIGLQVDLFDQLEVKNLFIHKYILYVSLLLRCEGNKSENPSIP